MSSNLLGITLLSHPGVDFFAQFFNFLRYGILNGSSVEQGAEVYYVFLHILPFSELIRGSNTKDLGAKIICPFGKERMSHAENKRKSPAGRQ